ncbi:MAG: chemotaxis response regulator protein-glutamate methylesterase [Ignavibacteriae bacterium]|nr:chemotaxis response regulator protein-glutamate methylesterase [Ignavibacteriota bacterium]NOG97128.1 chemotaxis response regulator protein-glutamate methylesterase [Ignavibacteriota bacterium]
MRKSLSLMLESDPDIKVVGTARNGLEGYQLVVKEKPDIVTLDIEMPVMDGLTSLKKIMQDSPTSVIMVSSLTTEGAESTMKAFEYGAVDFIPKGMSHVNIGIVDVKQDLINKVKEIYKQKTLQARFARLRSASNVKPAATARRVINSKIPTTGFKAVGLGISTGGPLSLQKVIPLIEDNFNLPIFIVQHMPPKFTKSLADRLNGLSKVDVKEAENNELVKNGTVYIAPGGSHMTVQKGSSGNRIKISDKPDTTLHRPSVDVMLNSVIDIYGRGALGIIMTGMGKDGSEGIKKLKDLGGYCVAQDEASCVVYGMPRAVVENGSADVVLPLDKISEIINQVGQNGRRI